MTPDKSPLKNATQSFVSEKIQGESSPLDAAARAADEMITAVVRKTAGRSGAVPKDEIVREVCHGAINALLLADLDLPKGAVILLDGMASVAQEVQVDPQELVTWALEGISRIANAVPKQKVADIAHAVDERFMGTAEVFRELCRKAAAP
ncbi:MAG: hypothetical protein AUJ52_12330 [Elusimicrobia bacterium CG1_02_63_36]|nr:MAG: hypothetical protein AUJ52_12330 [Elusimicrobia bacterium CG1_02_63_36]PIP83690.1 MAG: hypothetical protein COR54_08300 [Elusimicrobia bacterium CG22_combo_CG10-13_8_21_14_all_63_91]PJA15599.1 MAG: hypothetical protein COX66_09780 [Elusimicrobia bacterium CG_4_10_14_0_2_um_filter_63_34]PJB26532.1 MAG: hypothetical protein CO113_03170 [Elusimicrobia bacterium CG_4_9_14_3_um_filter_62_55]